MGRARNDACLPLEQDAWGPVFVFAMIFAAHRVLPEVTFGHA